MRTVTFDPAVLDALGVPLGSVSLDSRGVAPGDLFLAFPGERSDGRAFIGQAIERGAAAVLWDPDAFAWDARWSVPHAPVARLRTFAGEIAACVYGQPSEHLWVAGVTGTNGKTSCSHWIARSLQRCGRKAAVMGTLGNGFPGSLAPSTHTTADPVTVQRQLRALADQGAQAVAMEVSSHALDQGRVAGVRFATALFTNLTRDHLDYHGDMTAYGEAKARLFLMRDLANAVINVDDQFGRELVARIDRTRTRVLTYGIGHGDISGRDVSVSTRGVELRIRSPWGDAALRSRVIGGFNVSNLLGVLGVLITANLPLDEAIDALAQVEPVAGRFDMLRMPGAPLVVVDYAHTPDALEKALETLRELVGHVTGARLFCVFGCGGDRDPGKRPVMGEIATRLSDLAIITSDNPRSEDPRAIVAQIAAAAGPNHETEVDREAAIVQALRLAGENDVVLIAGKGHETTQEIGGQRFAFDDLEVARRTLREGREGTHV
ncbi:MAG: UDP-N-acetylmuramoyl-L-alanyl-D-glutamate--2,6-diaminopimelate ligase [Betaproteobacteria bacterium]|jgi:UDP-N-acetylmuramoyl-L-alanyl-D-glutamate--2,6-diaminopimelate ligase